MAQVDPLRIIVQNLSFESSKEDLASKFSELGNVVEAVLALDASGRSRGFGFVTFDKPDAVAKAVEEGRVFELDNRVLRVQVANQKKEPRSGGGGGDRRGGAPREIKAVGSKLYCGDLPWELSAEELTEHFEAYGKVVNAYLAEVQFAASVNGYKPHRGFGFVEFSSEDEATAALKAQHVIKGSTVRLTSAKGEAKGGDDKRRRPRERGPREEKKATSPKPRSGNNNNNAEKKTSAAAAPAPAAAGSPAKKPAVAAAAAPPAQPPAQKKSGIKVAAAPSVNPWAKKGGAVAEAAAANPSDFPTLGDVTSGKVKPKKKTEDEIAAEIAAERAKEKKGKAPVEGKGKEEL